MEKVRYMISDAAHIAGVESHVLRYWEDELELSIPRNEMGHRYYTRENIQEFQKIKELKEKGYQLKAIRMILHNGGVVPEEGNLDAPTPAKPGPAISIVPSAPAPASCAVTRSAATDSLSAEDRMAQFREIMNHIVGQAISQNNEELSLTISRDVKETVLKEMNYLFREQEEMQDMRYKKLDAAIRGNIRKKRLLFGGKERAEEPVEKKEDKKEARKEKSKKANTTK